MKPAERLRYLVLAAQRDGNRVLAGALAPLGLTPAQAEAIRVVADYGPLSLTALGELLVCEAGTNPSRLVDRVVSAGLVERTVDVADRRRVTLQLTDAGRAIEAGVAQVEAGLAAAIAERLAAVPDLDAVLSALEELTGGMPAGEAYRRRVG
ncbi:winged helix DNA-binding protein [soil metagenome]